MVVGMFVFMGRWNEIVGRKTGSDCWKRGNNPEKNCADKRRRMQLGRCLTSACATRRDSETRMWDSEALRERLGWSGRTESHLEFRHVEGRNFCRGSPCRLSMS